jgi:hypothetical protein
MEGTRTGATAMLVGTQDVEGRPAASVTVARDEIEEALASDESPELTLAVQLGEDDRPRELHVAWRPADLETILSGSGPGGITFAFEPDELYRALEHPDFEGHGMREAILLTVAAASASAAVAAGTASAGLVEGTGAGGAATAAVVSPGHDEASTASTLASASVVTAAHDEASTAGTVANPAAARDEATLVDRGITEPPAPVDSGTGLELPSIDTGTAAAIGGIAGAGLLIVGGTFAARRRIGTA